jgi:spore maturation protein CgeB
MRVAIVDTYYQQFIRAAYAATPAIAEASYQDQQSHLIGLRFGTSNVYSAELRRLGHEAWELIANCVPLQRAWLYTSPSSAVRRSLLGRLPARADPRRPLTRAWLLAILREQIRELDPDVVYLQHPGFAPPRLTDRPGRLVAGQLASAPRWPALIKQLDLLLTSFPHMVSVWRSQGVDTEYLPLAFDSRLIPEVRGLGSDPSPNSGRPRRVSFVGGVDPRVHGEGVAVLEGLISAGIPIEVFGYGADRLDPRSPIHGSYQGEAWGVDLYRIYAESQVVVNRHIKAARGFANNLRLFEATGMGAALVTEAAPNLPELFSPDHEVATYGCGSDLVETVRSLLVDDRRRLELASAGHERVLAEHTFGRRIEQLVPILEDRLRKRRRR